MQFPSIVNFALRKLVLALSLVACALPVAHTTAAGFSWPGSEKIRGNGVMQQQVRKLAPFRAVALNVPGELELRLGATDSITIESDANVLPLINTVVENGTLTIAPAKPNLMLKTHHMKLVLTAKNIDRISVGDSGSVEAVALTAKQLAFSIAGSGSINIQGVQADELSVSVGGSGDFKSNGGKARILTLSISGSGDVDLGRVQTSDAAVSISGSGDAVVWATKNLSTAIVGSGDVNYYGDPTVSRSVTGSGSTERLGTSPR